MRGNVPRYDVPKAAPEPLRQVQLLINSVDLHNEVDWLPGWLAERGVPAREAPRARAVREALRALVLGHNGFPVADEAVAAVNEATARLRIRVDSAGRITVSGRDAIDEVVAVAVRASLDGTFRRLKACRNCRWSFYDYSPNRSATWCSMQLCGNRTKTRAYRRRKLGA
jgi:predicted RNA-binding Zn ribbon-like protein